MIDSIIISTKIYAGKAKEKLVSSWNAFINHEAGGAEILATIVLVAIVVLLAVSFRSQLGKIVADIWTAISGKTSDLTADFPTA